MSDLSRFGERIWTTPKMKKAALEQKNHILYLDIIHYPEIFKDFDENVFKLRPDLVFNIQSYNHNADGEEIPYSKEVLEAISNMKYLKNIQMQFKFVQNLNEFYAPNLTSFSLNFYKKTKNPMSLAFVRNMPNLCKLGIRDNEYTDFDAITTLKKLKKLEISNVALNDLSAITNTEIEHLMLDSCRLNCDLSWLAKSKIQSLLFCQNSNVVDLSFISQMTMLNRLSISQAKATTLPDFTLLSSLEELHLDAMKSLENIATISSAQCLKTLYIAELSAKIKAEDLRILLELPNLENVYIDFLDFGKKRINAVKKMFQEAGKEHLLKEGLITLG